MTFGFASGGSLSTGHVTGICRSCATVLQRSVWGFGAFMSGIRPALAGRPFSVNGSRPCGTHEPVALFAVLAELDETGLSDFRGPGPWLPYLRKAEAMTQGNHAGHGPLVASRVNVSR